MFLHKIQKLFIKCESNVIGLKTTQQVAKSLKYPILDLAEILVRTLDIKEVLNIDVGTVLLKVTFKDNCFQFKGSIGRKSSVWLVDKHSAIFIGCVQVDGSFLKAILY